MNSFLLKSFSGGFSDFEDKGIAGSFKSGQSLDIRKRVDSLSCNQALVEEGAGVIADLIRFIVPCTDGNAYGFGNAGKIYKRTSAGTWTLVYTDTAEPDIKGACEWFLSTGKTYLFWATNTRLNCKEIPGNATWSVDVNALAGWPKTTLTSATWHTMIQAVGSLQIANSDYLAMVGYDGSYTNAALNLFKKNYAKALLERNRSVIVGTPRVDMAQESSLVSWDTSSQAWNDKKIIMGGAINAMVDTDLPLMQVGTSGGIYYGDLQNIMPILTIPGGGYCNPGGVTVDDGLALFGIYENTIQNGIYSYGRKKKNQNHTLNLEYPLTCNEIGAVCKVGSDILVTYKYGTSYKVMKVDSATKATAYYYSLDLKAPVRMGYLPTWGMVILSMKPLPNSCAVRVYYKLDKAGSFIQAKMQGNLASASTVDSQEAVFLVGEKARILEVEIELVPNANTTPEIYKAEVYFE